MTTADQFLVRALAVSDSIRLPVRHWGTHAGANRAQGLAAIREDGIPLRVGGSVASRLSGARLLIELANEDLLLVTHPKGEQAARVRLTRTGEARARALCGLPARYRGLLFVDDLLRLERERIAEHGERVRTDAGVWVPEVAFTLGRGWGLDAPQADRDRLADLELEFLPAASAGWAEVHSSSGGNAAYRVTDAGRAEAEDPGNPYDDDLPAEDEQATRLYRRECDTKAAELRDSKPDRDLGALPLIECVIGYTRGVTQQ